MEGEPGEEQRGVRVLLAGRRRRRRRGGRAHQVLVRLDDEEFAAIAARATACRLTVASYLAAAGNRDATDGGGGGWSVEQRRALVAELFAVQRVLRGVATNLNQLTALANTQREIPPGVAGAAETAARLMARVERVVVALDPEG
ncbi:MAG: plasmid mobilization protein [Candidatus Dormibacteria bacterium]